MNKLLPRISAVAALAVAATLLLAPFAMGGPNCPSVARVWLNPDGTIKRARIVCLGPCQDATQACKPDKSRNSHGGVREWCDCKQDGMEDTTSPNSCHPVVYTPGKGEGGGPPQVLCAGACATGATCRQVIVASGGTNGHTELEDITCRCN